ncbi:unnamed protein product [Rotaria sp. Silwood1]|nr:unnamed protein product [Rotaria sp. Silwood1]
MPAPASRRSLAARRCTRKLSELDDDIDDKENSLNDSLTGRRRSRILNNSLNGIDEPIQTPKQLVDLYQKTLELATQGKINIKNAFNIPLVERLPQILNVIALDDKDNHNLGPNFVKAGSVIDTSAKIYGFRVDALHTETQKLSGNILNTDEEELPNGTIKEEGRTDIDSENIHCEEGEIKKPIRRNKAKTTTFILTDLSKITLEHEFQFRPLQSPHICQWRGGIGADSIYAEMVSNTMYSSSDYPLIDGFTNVNIQIDEQETKINNILDNTINHMIDLILLRSVIKINEGHDHVLGRNFFFKFNFIVFFFFVGNSTLREFVFNEIPSSSFIDTIHETCLVQMDESINKSCITNDDIDNNNYDDGYNHEELIHAAIEDLNDDPSHANEVFKNALNELSNPEPSTMYSNLGNFQSQQSINSNLPLSSSFMSTMSFVDQMPNLLNSKDGQSEYSYFDATKLKLFAGPNIWKFTNLLNITQPITNISIVQHQQAPVTPHKITGIIREGPKRNIRIDIFNQISIEQIMLNYNNNGRDKKSISTSQSSLLLRIREKSLNQMQLARKIRPLNDLINFYNFPNLNIEYLNLINQRKVLQQQQKQHYYDQDDYDHDDNHHIDDENSFILTSSNSNMTDQQQKNNETADQMFHGVPLNDIPNLFQAAPTVKDMQDINDVGHTFMIKPFKYDSSNPNLEPEPIHGMGNYFDIWNDDYVHLPCSPFNNDGTQKWPIIQQKLIQLKQKCDEKTATVNDIKIAIEESNGTSFEIGCLEHLLNQVYSAEERAQFISIILSKMISLALDVGNICSQPPPLLRNGTYRSVTMSQRQAGSLLACAFFCLFPHQFNDQISNQHQTYQSINFIHLFRSGSPWKLEKLKCILHYFRRICEDMPKGVLTFRRFALPDAWIPKWIESQKPLCKIHLRKDTTIEDMHGLLQVDFANEFIGGGVMNEGIVQEEIRFTICTEMLVSVLICQVMLSNECIFLIGCEQYVTYSGYARTFKAKDNFIDKTPKDSWGRKLSHVVAMDAINYLNPLNQYTIESMNRELIKAYTCFRIPKSMENFMFGVATGKWGCGAFNGDAQLKGMSYQ